MNEAITESKFRVQFNNSKPGVLSPNWVDTAPNEVFVTAEEAFKVIDGYIVKYGDMAAVFAPGCGFAGRFRVVQGQKVIVRELPMRYCPLWLSTDGSGKPEWLDNRCIYDRESNWLGGHPNDNKGSRVMGGINKSDRWLEIPAGSTVEAELRKLNASYSMGPAPGDAPTTPSYGVSKVETKTVAIKKGLPHDDKSRKALPVFRGPLMYFPDAICEVARLCKIGNDQHNPGQPMHWARGKSTEQLDTAVRHMMDHGMGNTKDTDGVYHMAKAAWRCLAELQLTIEKERA